MSSLTKGQNAALPTGDVCDVVVSVEVAAAADLSALLVTEAGKVRTRSKSLALLADKVAQAKDPSQVFVFDAQAPDIDDLIKLLEPVVPRDEIEFGTIGPVIGTHAGPRTIGLGWVDAP